MAIKVKRFTHTLTGPWLFGFYPPTHPRFLSFHPEGGFQKHGVVLGTVLQVLQEEDAAADARLALKHLIVKVPTAPSVDGKIGSNP